MVVNAAGNIWATFNENPVRENFERCSEQVKISITEKFPPLQSPTYLTLIKPETFAPLLGLIEKGNVYALRLGFQLIPIALENASVSEKLIISLGQSIKAQPELFLNLLEDYQTNNPEIAEHLLISTQEGMDEEWDSELREINLRVASIEKVQDPKLINTKKQSIDILEKHIELILKLRKKNDSPEGRP